MQSKYAGVCKNISPNKYIGIYFSWNFPSQISYETQFVFKQVPTNIDVKTVENIGQIISSKASIKSARNILPTESEEKEHRSITPVDPVKPRGLPTIYTTIRQSKVEESGGVDGAVHSGSFN